jgi:hypothetical protein
MRTLFVLLTTLLLAGGMVGCKHCRRCQECNSSSVGGCGCGCGAEVLGYPAYAPAGMPQAKETQRGSEPPVLRVPN